MKNLLAIILMLALGANVVEAHAPFYMKESNQTARLSCDDTGCTCDDDSSDEE